MKLTAADWQVLRKPTLTLAGALLLGAALVYFSQRELKLTRLQQKAQESALHEARNRLQKSGDEKERILRYRSDYMALQQIGFVGEEQRINWVDALRAASLSLKMFGVSYQIEAQQPYGSPLAADAGGYRLQQSVMKISMGLLHEEDLLRFLAALEEQKAGIFAVRECSLQRQSGARVENLRMQPHVQADCSLLWLTANEAKPGETP